MIYTFDNEEIVDVEMFKKILPTDIRTTFHLIQKYAGLLNAPPDSVLYHKALVFLKHLRYRYHVYSFDFSPSAKQFCLAYEKAFPLLKVEAQDRPPVEPPYIEWNDEDLDEVNDDGTLLPCECEDSTDTLESNKDVEADSQLVEKQKHESTESVKKQSPLEVEQNEPRFKQYEKKIQENKRIIKQSLEHLEQARNRTKELSESPPISPKVRRVPCSPSFGMQMTRAIHGVPVKYAAKGSRVARKLLGLPDDCEAHLYVDHSGIYYACGGETEIDCVRAFPVKDREYFSRNAYSYKGGLTPILLMLCDVPLQDPGDVLLKVSDAETLSWEKQSQDMQQWINHLKRDGHSQVT